MGRLLSVWYRLNRISNTRACQFAEFSRRGNHNSNAIINLKELRSKHSMSWFIKPLKGKKEIPFQREKREHEEMRDCKIEDSRKWKLWDRYLEELENTLVSFYCTRTNKPVLFDWTFYISSSRRKEKKERW